MDVSGQGKQLVGSFLQTRVAKDGHLLNANVWAIEELVLVLILLKYKTPCTRQCDISCFHVCESHCNLVIAFLTNLK